MCRDWAERKCTASCRDLFRSNNALRNYRNAPLEQRTRGLPSFLAWPFGWLVQLGCLEWCTYSIASPLKWIRGVGSCEVVKDFIFKVLVSRPIALALFTIWPGTDFRVPGAAAVMALLSGNPISVPDNHCRVVLIESSWTCNEIPSPRPNWIELLRDSSLRGRRRR